MLDNWMEFVPWKDVNDGDIITSTVPILTEIYPYYKNISGDNDQQNVNKMKLQPHFYRQNIGQDSSATEVDDVKVENITAYWKEVKYTEKEKIREVSVKDNEPIIEVPNKRITTTIQIKKVDSENNQSLAGAIFGIFKKATNELLYESDPTDENGIATFDQLKLDEGDYYVKEITAPTGYVLSNEIQEFTVDKTNSFEFTFSNEHLKGSYNIEINKLEELLGKPLQGAKFSIKAYKENEEIKLYKSTEDITSMEEIIPAEFTIDSEDATLSIPNIRIDQPENYTLEITETQAPDTYSALRDPIKLKVTTGISEENDKYVLKSVELDGSDNDGLVKVTNTEDKITVNVTNNQFDLALRKYISSINGEDVTRWNEPQVDTAKLITGEDTTAEYYNKKQPILLQAGQEIIYTLRIYNEGQIDGWANKIVDHLPEELEFLPKDEFNIARRWKYVESDKSLRTIETDYLSKDVANEDGLVKAFNTETGDIDYVEVQVKCKVKEDAQPKTYITNIAEITEYEGKDRPNVVDRDNKEFAEIPSDEDLPDYKQDEIEKEYVPGQEDDDDFEKVFVEKFDLALYKWVTEAIVTQDGKTTTTESKHTQDDKSNVVNVSIPNDKLNDVVVKFKYTIKVENQGSLEGYAKEIKDHIPQGLKFLEEDNAGYGWVEQEDGTITTDYLKDTLLKEGETAEVPVILTWINSQNNLGKKVNYAEISKDYNEYDLPDIDSSTDNFKLVPREDDEDGDLVMLQVRTGMSGPIYGLIAIIALGICAAGVVICKKRFSKEK